MRMRRGYRGSASVVEIGGVVPAIVPVGPTLVDATPINDSRQ